MMNHTNKNIDLTADIIHTLAVEFKTTLREINNEVWNKVYEIVCFLNKKHTEE